MCVYSCRYGAAELDCTAAVAMDPTYVKAYSRRGTARLALRQFKEAKEDFVQVLKLEPNNKQAKAETEKIERVGIRQGPVSFDTRDVAGELCYLGEVGRSVSLL